MALPVPLPIEPMLAKAGEHIPEGDEWIFEPKWDGFRAIAAREGDKVELWSREQKPLARYFPELAGPLAEVLPERCVLDGEIVIAGPHGLDFDRLLLRIHPAASRIQLLAKEHPASLVVWDLLALGEDDLRGVPFAQRRARLEETLGQGRPPLFVTPCTRDRAVASDWFHRFEGAGLDGVIAKRASDTYQPGKRVMQKIKHARTADCAVAGFRWHKNGPGTLVGSLLLGLFDAEGTLHHVGIAGSFTTERRRELALELAPLREGALEDHPWRSWAAAQLEQRMPGATSRWNRGKDLGWEPLRVERVCEVAYDHLQGSRFRHATHFRRWRPDKSPADCRYDQLDSAAPAELAAIFGER